MAVPLTFNAFNRLGQYANSPSNRPYRYKELAVYSQRWLRPSPLLVAPTHGGMARLSRRGWLVKYQDGRPIPANGHPSQY